MLHTHSPDHSDPDKPAAEVIHSDIPETSSIRAIKYLTCQGGGMKAVGQVGAIEALEKCGVLAQLEEVAGSSAGGIIATLLAIGCTAEEIRTEMMNINFIALQDKAEPGWLESTRIKDLAHGGSEFAYSIPEKIGLIKKIPMGRKGGVVSTLEKIEDVVGVALGTDLGLWKGEALAHCIGNIVARKTGNPNITFQELATLAQAPDSHFKKLTLTGSNLTDSKLEYYNATNTPNMSIVEAVRISASFPGAYQPVNQDGKIKVDGGLLENLPDVFNKPPYISDTTPNSTGGNPKAFALSFDSPEREIPMEIHNGIDLAKALYASARSEGHLQKKYGQNIVYIDPAGLKTLEFDAPVAKKRMAVQSGARAVYATFQTILEAEAAQTIQYRHLSIEELTRRERALLGILANSTPEDKKTDRIKEEIIVIGEEIATRGIEETQLADWRAKADAAYLKKQKRSSPKALSDETLSALCKDKREELDRVTIELQEKLKQLRLAKHALEFNRDQILTRLTSQWEGNAFVQELDQLKQFENLLHENRIKKIDAKDTAVKLALENDYIELKRQREAYIDSLILQYESKHDTLLTDFFKDLKIDMAKPGFKMPNTFEELNHYCSEDIYACMEYIDVCVREIKSAKQEQDLYGEYSEAFLKRGEKSNQLDTLLQMESALRSSLYRKTTLIAKINTYLIQKAPKFEKVIIPFLKAVSVLAFVCWLPLAIPAVGIAKTISHFTSNPDTRTTAENVVNFFRWTDLDMHKRLRGIQADTALFITKMSDDYVSADRSEATYLKKLYEVYLQNSGVTLEDIFIKDPNETLAQYKARLQVMEQKLRVEGADPKSQQSQQGNALEAFKQQTHLAVARRTEKERQRLSVAPNGSEAQGSIKNQQIRSLHLHILHEAEEKIKRGKALTAQEITDYQESARATHKPLSKQFQTHYADMLEQRNRTRIQPTLANGSPQKRTLTHESQQDAQALTFFSKERQKQHGGKKHGKRDPARTHSPKRPHKKV